MKTSTIPLVLLAAAGSAAALPAQGAQLPPGSYIGAKIGVPVTTHHATGHAAVKRAGMAYEHVAPGDCSVKGVSCKQHDVEHGILGRLWAKVTGN